ncbi:MAG: nitrogen regulation protein NR(II) [Gemmatimonadales bacterium]
MSVPLSRVDVAAVRAALGGVGRFDGVDHLGTRVMADLRQVAGTPWFLVTKVDEAEVHEEVRRRGWFIALIGVLLLLLTGAFAASGYRRQQAEVVYQMYLSELKERKAQAVFRSTLYSIGDAVITTDPEQRVTAMNRVAEELTGWRDAEARGRPLDDVYRTIDEMTRVPVRPGELPVPAGDESPVLISHALLLGRSGDERPIASSTAPIVDDAATVLGTVTVFRDQATERAQEARIRHSERLASMGRMAGGIAHDFNNVLSVIAGAATLARQLPHGQEAAAELEVVEAATARAADLTSQLLAFAREQPRTPRRFAPGERLQELAGMVRRLAGPHITFSLDGRDGARAFLEMDPTQFDQVVMNLVVNACDAMPDGGTLRIHCDVETLEATRATSAGTLQPGRYVRIGVEDTGAGMSGDTVKEIFEPFFTTKGDRGTGLGLATVSAIVRAAEGLVTVTSRVGSGTRFEIFLPAVG